MRDRTFVALLALCLSVAPVLGSKETVPSENQTTLLRGTAEVANGIRSVTGERDATGHGPITYYQVPFQEGALTLSWKVEKEQRVVLVFDGKANGKATHALKVYFNGGPTKKSTPNNLTLVTYDGSTKEKKKAKIIRRDYHADAGKWHEVSVTFEGKKATVIVGRETVTVTSDRFIEPIEKSGIGHFTGTLQTRDVKIHKAK